MLSNNIRTRPHLEVPSNLHSPQPFVGVCGVRGPDDYHRLVALAPTILRGTEAFIMAGIKDRSVQLDPTYLSPLVRPFMHCDYSPDEPYGRTITETVTAAAPFIRGLQLNVLPWMDTSYEPLLARTKRLYPHVRLMLQAHRQIMEQHSPEAVARAVTELPVDYVLFDPSQSKGEPYQTEIMRRFVAATRRFAPWMGIVVAGGLGDEEGMKNHLAPIANQKDTISCDAFLRLQDPSGAQLDWVTVGRYLSCWRRIITNPPAKLFGGITSANSPQVVMGSYNVDRNKDLLSIA